MEKIQQSKFYNHAARLTENMTLDAAYIGETVPSNIVMKSATLIIDSGKSLTIGEGKTLVPDVYNIFAINK